MVATVYAAGHQARPLARCERYGASGHRTEPDDLHTPRSAAAARIISALPTLREHVIAPLLAGVADPRIRRTPRHWTDIDRHYQALRLEMMALFADLGIACG